MNKWKLVPVELWRELEPYLGKDAPDREVVLLSDVKGVLAAPHPPRLSDERILEIYEEAKANWNAQADQCNQWSDLGVDEVVTLVARAVEREILGGAQS
jgi:hypothetical protein